MAHTIHQKGRMRMTLQELLFFDPMPHLPIYEALRKQLEHTYPEMSIKVSKTQLSFRNRSIFAMVSLPYRKRKGWPKEYLLVSFGLPYKKESPRIAQAVEPYPNRWTHHVIVTVKEEIDQELLQWIGEAFPFSQQK